MIGARGAIATCVAYGLSGLRQGLLQPVGLTTECDPLNRMDLVGIDPIVLGGHEIAEAGSTAVAGELVRAGVLPAEVVAAGSGDAAALDASIRPGILDLAEVGRAALDPAAASMGGASPRAKVDRLREDIESFRRETGAGRVVVVYLASAEPAMEEFPHWQDLAAFEKALDEEGEFPASSLYAYSALTAGCPFVNFTPNHGASIQALRQLAIDRGLPHCGNDGKTGETLLKTALAPMFKKRALRVLAWQGYNMLGNRDGETLRDPLRRATKCRNKDAPLHAILGDARTHTQVGIDFVPSLHDWKTAMDFVHFEGFLGAKMSLQFTWAGSDSALAAPLVIDLARLAEFAARKGESGEMPQTACFFKSPLAGGSHDFHEQHGELVEYALKHAT
jgi:myo-inositol-1-phosphate synthase